MSKKAAQVTDIPVQTESIKMRSALMAALKQHIERIGLSQATAAKALGVTQPRISDLMRGKISLFSLDTLVEMAAAAGLQVKIQVTPLRRC
ncbi:MAG TPA: XRE family transcriptional regulator [Steroidobacteraceae bacterium]|jgi:predicted XRE-type DNA-binding protein|nr:XRE family transcriptional regulator [Steroidobacteraceae bacterium]